MADATVVAGATHLGDFTQIGAILEVVGPAAGLEIFDVGCGEGANGRRLAQAGARVHGFDPFMDDAEWVAEGEGAFRIVRATADALPVDDAVADVVLFSYSLHHVPQPKLAGAMAEARRVLKPTGRLIVVEPLASGPSYYVSRPFHDEGPVRAAAQAAIADHAVPRFGTRRTLSYTERRNWGSFEGYAARMIANMRFNGYTEEAVLQPEVRRRFDEMFAAGDGLLEQGVRIDVLSEPRRD